MQIKATDKQYLFRFSMASLISAISILVIYFRKHDLFTYPQFHAEDGVVLFTDATYRGCWPVFETYAGYFITFQRFVACAGTFVPTLHVPTFYFYCSLVAVIAIIFYIFSERVLMPYKPLVALSITCAPVQNEVFFGPTNSQWILCLGLLLLVISAEPKTWRQAVFDILTLLLLGLTGPYCIIFLPLYILGAVWHRTRWSIARMTLCASTAILQWMQIETIERMQGNSNELLQHCRVLIWYFGHMFVGPWAAISPTEDRVWLFYSLAVLSLLIYIALIVFAYKKRDFPLLVMICAGPLIIAPTLYAFQQMPQALVSHGSRYYYIPTVSFAWVMIILLRYNRWLATLSLIAMASNVLIWFPHYQGPSFKNHDWAKHSACLNQEDEICILPHPPQGWYTSIYKKQEK